MTSIFDTLDNKVRIDNSRNDDKPGVYWQRIDSIGLPKTQRGVEYVRIAKTTVKVAGDPEGVAHEVGTETTQALFRDDFDYLEKDLRTIAGILLGLTPKEASEIPFMEIKERLIDKGEANGEVVEIRVYTGGVSVKSGKPWVKHEWLYNVTEDWARETEGAE